MGTGAPHLAWTCRDERARDTQGEGRGSCDRLGLQTLSLLLWRQSCRSLQAEESVLTFTGRVLSTHRVGVQGRAPEGPKTPPRPGTSQRGITMFHYSAGKHASFSPLNTPLADNSAQIFILIGRYFIRIISDENSVPNNIDLHKIVTEHLVEGPCASARGCESERRATGDLVVRSLGQQRRGVCGYYLGELLGPTHEDSLRSGGHQQDGRGRAGGLSSRPSAAQSGDLWLPGHLGPRPMVFPRGPWTHKRRGQAPTGVWRKIYRVTLRLGTAVALIRYQAC